MTFTDLPRLELPEGCSSIEDLMSVGRYGDLYGEFTSDRFKKTLSGLRSVKLAHVGERIATSAVEEVARQQGYAGARLEELLCVGMLPKYKKLPFPIVATGSCVYIDGAKYIPALFDFFKGRYVFLQCYTRQWAENTRFLVTGL